MPTTRAIELVPPRSKAIATNGTAIYLGGREVVGIDSVTGTQTRLYPAGTGWVTGLAANSRWVYAGYSDGSVMGVSLDGATVQVRQPSTRRAAAVVRLSCDERFVLSQVRSRDHGVLAYYDMDGGTSINIAEDVTSATMDSSFIYYLVGNQLSRRARDQNLVEELGKVPDRAGNLAVFETSLYYTSEDSVLRLTRLYRFRINDRTTQELSSFDFLTGGDSWGLVLTDHFAYLSSTEAGLYRIPLDSPVHSPPSKVAQRGSFDDDDWDVLIGRDGRSVYWAAFPPGYVPVDEDDPLTLFSSTCTN